VISEKGPIALRPIARALVGEVVGAQVFVSGPGHSRRDRSLSVRLSPPMSIANAKYGFARRHAASGGSAMSGEAEGGP
jgi:hypothetical protein